METYRLPYSSAQLAAAVGFGNSPDATPTEGSTKGVTSGGVADELAAQETQTQTSLDQLQDEMDDVKSVIESIDEAWKYADYNIRICDTTKVVLQKNPSAPDSTTVGIERVGNVFTLDGIVRSDETDYFRLNGTPTRTKLTSTVNTWTANPAVLKVGHKYRLSLKHTNGDKTITGIYIAPTIAGESTFVGFSVPDGDNYIREFIATGTAYNIVLVLSSGTTFDNDEYIYSFADVTEARENDSLFSELTSVTEQISVQKNVTKLNYGSGKFNTNTKARTIYFECEPGASYIIDRKALTYEFYVGWSESAPASDVPCTLLFNAANEVKVQVIAPVSAKYIFAYMYNGNRPQDTSIGTGDEVSAAATVTRITAIDTVARSEVDKINGMMSIDVSNVIKWEIGSLGSVGENYARNYEARTTDYIPFKPLKSVTFDIPLNSRLCLYGASKNFLHRYQLTDITSFDLNTIKTNYPTTEYIRFTVYEGATPLVDTSISENVNIIRAGTMTVDEFETIENIPYPDMLKLHKADKEKAEVFKTQRTTSEQYGKASLKLLFFTDVHNEIGRVGRAVTLMNNWGSDYFDVAVNGGDTTYSFFDATQLAQYDAQINNSTIPVLNTIGNHDAYSTLEGARPLVPQTTIYGAITAKVKENVPGIVQPDDAEENGLNYYYYDVGSIRVVILDCMYWDATELAWFKSVLSDAVTNTKAVIAVAHYNFVSTATEYVNPCTWNPSGYGVGGSASYPLPIEAAQAVKEFQDNDGEFIIWLCGHSHGDSIKKLLPEYGNQYQLICSSFVNRAGTVFKSTDPYSYNYDVLTYIVVDTYYKIVKGMRIGANINEQGMEYNTFSIKYDTGEFLSSC